MCAGGEGRDVCQVSEKFHLSSKIQNLGNCLLAGFRRSTIAKL